MDEERAHQFVGALLLWLARSIWLGSIVLGWALWDWKVAALMIFCSMGSIGAAALAEPISWGSDK